MSNPLPARWIALLLAMTLLLRGEAPAAQTRSKAPKRSHDVSIFRKQHLDRREKYVGTLEALASDCEAKNLPEAAAEIRSLAEPVDTSELRLAPLPRAVQPSIDASVTPEERWWRTQLQNQRSTYANDLYALSRRTLGAG